jgi:hypothetical protein
MSEQASQEETRTGIHPADQPITDVQQTATDDTSAPTETPVPFPGTAKELRWSRFGPHLPLGTLTASNPITQAEVNLTKAKVQS